MIDTPASFRLGTISSSITRATFARRGLSVPVACTGAMDGSAKLTVSSATRKRLKLRSATLDSTDVRCWGPHTVEGVVQAVVVDRSGAGPQGRPEEREDDGLGADA